MAVDYNYSFVVDFVDLEGYLIGYLVVDYNYSFVVDFVDLEDYLFDYLVADYNYLFAVDLDNFGHPDYNYFDYNIVGSYFLEYLVVD